MGFYFRDKKNINFVPLSVFVAKKKLGSGGGFWSTNSLDNGGILPYYK